jgi:hypothetical protein
MTGDEFLSGRDFSLIQIHLGDEATLPQDNTCLQHFISSRPQSRCNLATFHITVLTLVPALPKLDDDKAEHNALFTQTVYKPFASD